MKSPNNPVDGSPSQRPKLTPQPKPYVDANDMHLLLKLGLGLHSMADPRVRLERACNGLCRLTASCAWVAATITVPVGNLPGFSLILAGGEDPQTASAAAKEFECECLRPDTTIGNLIAEPKHIPGRVLAMLDKRKFAIHSVLHPEEPGGEHSRLTWISAYRRESAAPFSERERRMVELFHSQSTWLLNQLGE